MAKPSLGVRVVWTVLVVILTIAAIGLWRWDSTPKEQWIDEALGHSGQILAVNRAVEFTFGGGELSSALRRWPNKYSLEFVHPSTGRKIAWHGEKNVDPILLDIVAGTPWLVVNSSRVYSNVELYGCPELPYAFLRFDLGASRWIPVAVAEAPPALREANLSSRWEAFRMERKRTQTPEDIAHGYRMVESSSSRFLTRTIPRNYTEWTYKFKKQHATSRQIKDCRPPLERPVDAIFPKGQVTPSVPVQLEVLDVKTYSPEWVIKEEPTANQSTWSQYAWDAERAKACDALTRPADQEDQRLVSWRVFVLDPSGKRLFSPTHMLCDPDAIWFFNYVAEPGRMTIVKTTTAGDILYRASFPKPDEVGGYLGAVMSPTLRARDGYLYFEWWNSNQSGSDRHIKRSIKARFFEPIASRSSSQQEASQ